MNNVCFCIYSEVNLDIIDKYVEHLQKEGVVGVYSKCHAQNLI